MNKSELDGFKIGERVRIKGEVQVMTITHLEKIWFGNNNMNTMYQLPDKTMGILNNLPIKSVTHCNDTTFI